MCGEMKTSVYVPDELADRAKAAGVNLSATLRSALLELLDSPVMPMLAAVEHVIAGLDLERDAERVALAELARSLATKLDMARRSHSAAMALAAVSLSRELRSVVEVLAADGTANREFVASLFEGTPAAAWSTIAGPG
jgi:hypothetical protein